MQKNRLQMVVDECSRDLADEEATGVQGYYLHKGSWWDASNSVEAPPDVQQDLRHCLTQNAPYRARSSNTSNFPLREIQAVIRATFPAPLRSPRHEAIQRVVKRSFRNASNDFGVRFNPKTGLLGQSAFKELVEKRITEISAVDSTKIKSSSDESISPAVCLLALDIDHFKQVNDTHGHAYGDLVIRSFAMRIERAVQSFCQQHGGKIEATCAHVSGEEFFCVASGPVRTADFEQLAQVILAAVRDRALPSDIELETLATTYSAQEITIPRQGDREITCSIGGTIAGPLIGEDVALMVDRLVKQADLALYRSKNHGRDRSIFFPTVLQHGGRVLEHRPDVGVCIIDIGQDVGVVRGQEFTVFHPEFTGVTPYVLDDGRSKKILGTLPRSPLCTIAAFDVQRQISFCNITENSALTLNVPRNSVLEAIPLGTLSVPSSGKGGLPLGGDLPLDQVLSIAETQRMLDERIGEADRTAFAVVGVKNEKDLLSKYGPASVNRGLAAVCRRLQEIKRIKTIGQLAPTQLLARYAEFGQSDLEELRAGLVQAEQTMHGRIPFHAGVFSPGFPKKEDQVGIPNLKDLRARADLARYAASPEASTTGEADTRVVVFTTLTPQTILIALRDLRDFSRAKADYQRFVQLGVEHPSLHNAAGLVSSAAGEVVEADALYMRAATSAPRPALVYFLNALTIRAFRVGNMESAVQLLPEIDAKALSDSYKIYTYGTGAYAKTVAYVAANSRSAVDIDTAKAWIQRALSLEISEQARATLLDIQSRVSALTPVS